MTGLEPLILTTATSFLAPIVEEIFKNFAKDSGSKLLKEVGDIDIGQAIKEKIFEGSKAYIKRYDDRHGILKVLGMREPVKLELVYTGVKFLDDSGIRKFLSPDELEKSFRVSNNRQFQRECKTQDGIKVADEKQFLMVLGQPGAGKSTFLRRMGLEALKGKQEIARHKCIPVFLELKTFKDDKVDIEKQIVDEFRTCGFPEPEEFTKNALKQGKLLVLLDGLDEVPKANTNAVISQIENFVDRYDKNRFIASCRIAAYRSSFRRFFDVEMSDFDDEQIKIFINNWFQSEQDRKAETAQKCWELLKKNENKASKELAHTPLLLTFLCLVYERSQGFPTNRSSLYGKALRILLEEWAAEKRIEGWTAYEGLNTELEEILLAQIAYDNFVKDRLFFSKGEIVAQIKSFLADNLNAPKHLDGEAVLNAIAIQQGILVERSEDIFSFSHLTLQEYLTAQYIVDHNLIEQSSTEYFTDKRWQEVFLLVSGLMRGGADNLLLAMETQTEQLINSSSLLGLLIWADQVTEGSEGNFKHPTKRGGVIFIALALDIDLALDRNLVRDFVLYRILDSDRDLARDLAHAHDLARDLAHAHDLARAFAYDLDRDLLRLSNPEIASLNNYFYANKLMIQCKESAVRVSPQVWLKIEEMMLIPPSHNLETKNRWIY